MNPSVEIRDAVLRFYEAVATGDVSALERLFSRQSGVLAIGSDPDEWWAGHDTIVDAFKAQAQGMGTRKVVPGDLNAFVEGKVGWAADRRTMRLASGKQITIRETMLFHQEDGEWKLVQFHASVAVPNAELAG
jgi:ketosteroid isomerase-like protein